MYPDQKAVSTPTSEHLYLKLFEDSSRLSVHLFKDFGMIHGSKVALMAENTIEAVISLFAISRTGANVYLLNPEMSKSQFDNLCEQRKFNVIICEEDLIELAQGQFADEQILPLTKLNSVSVQSLIHTETAARLEKRKAGNVVVLTGGTTGDFKSAGRKQSISDFLNPLVALIDQLDLHWFKSVYIPTPIYHGYGLAALTISILMGSEVHLTPKFNADEACKLIKDNEVEVITLVPLMLQRMLAEDVPSLDSVKRILSGGAALNPSLTETALDQLGPILYNLYGTTEAGFCVIGTPEHLAANPKTIGKTIKGVSRRIDGSTEPNQVGELQIASKWIMGNAESRWIPTGDLAQIDEDGLIFLKGRTDNMIVSGGENVYPKELEDVLVQHEGIKTAAVIGVPDDEFGKRLKAFVVLKSNVNLSEEEIKVWLKSRVARYQMPKAIEFRTELPRTSIGKINKKQLA